MSDPKKQGVIVKTDGGDIVIQSNSHLSASATLALTATAAQVYIVPARFLNHISVELNTYLGFRLEWTIGKIRTATAQVAEVAQETEITLAGQTVAAQAAVNVGAEQRLEGNAVESSADAQLVAGVDAGVNAQLNAVDNARSQAAADDSQVGGQADAVAGEANAINSLRSLLTAELKDINTELNEINTAFNGITTKTSQYVAALNQVKGGLLAI
jgi:hypothetical protein